MKKTSATSEPTPVPSVTAIESLDQLRALCEKPIDCKFEIDGELVKVKVNRLPATFEDGIQALSREIVPPMVKGRNPQEEERPNYNDPKYLAAKARMEIVIRALTIYEGCPVVRAGNMGLQKQEDVVNYIQGLFSDTILNILYLTIASGGVKLWDRVNFTQPPVSES